MAVLLLVAPGYVQGQSISTRSVNTAGGSGAGQEASLDWAVGQVAGTVFDSGDTVVTAGVLQPDGYRISLQLGVLLGGPLDDATGLMRDDLRTQGIIPAQEPYTALGHPVVGVQPGGDLPASVTAVAGPDAIVDWVFVEFRDAQDDSRIVAARPALVQRDGDVVDLDGLSPVQVTLLPGAYHVAVRHRNHLPLMSQQALPIVAGANAVDFRTGAIPGHVFDAQAVMGSWYALWPGDVTGDGTVKYVGLDNDRDPLLVAIGGLVPTATATGYLPTDVNMDGVVKYVGTNNDRDRILLVIGGLLPTMVRAQPTP